MLKITKIAHKNTKKPNLIIQNISVDIGKKLYVPFYISYDNKKYVKIGSLIDSGSDIHLCQIHYLYRLFPGLSKKEIIEKIIPTTLSLTSYTSHTVKMYGLMKISIKFNENTPPQFTDMYIVDSTTKENCKSPVIFSLGLLGRFNINMTFDKIDNESIPILSRYIGSVKYSIDSFYCTDADLNITYGFTPGLEPGATEHIFFRVKPISPFLCGDSVLISQDQIPYHEYKDLKIVPSTSKLEKHEDNLYAHAFVTNTGIKKYMGAIKASIDFCEMKIIDINVQNRAKLDKLNINLISECKLPSKNKRNKTKNKVYLNKNISNTFCEQFVANPNIYKLDVNFPEFSPHLPNSKAENNDITTIGTSLTDERYPVKESEPFNNKELEPFYNNEDTIQLGLHSGEDIDLSKLNPAGFDIPDSLLEQPEDIMLEKDFKPEVWPYVKDIFLKNYPNVISRHSLDRGQISDTLGFFEIHLKPNISLPLYSKMYPSNPLKWTQMRTCLNFLEREGVVSKAKLSGGDLPRFASPAFILDRADKTQAGRLCINFRYLNECIKVQPIALNTLDNILHSLRGAALFSTVDLKSAFQSIELTEESKKLTMFQTSFGHYYLHTLATGMSSSPQALSAFVDKMINYVPVLDKQGQVMYDKRHYPIMVNKVMEEIQVYYDDILIFTKPRNTYTETLEAHFKVVKEVIKRLNFHKAKIEIAKAKFAKARLNFIGWLISGDKIQADPKRVSKLLNTPFPPNLKSMRSYLGLLNSLRNTLNFTVLKQLHVLTPLTSSAPGAVYNPNATHHQAFEDINKQLASGPLFAKLILPGVPKILLTDAASSNLSQFALVLAQIVPAKKPQLEIPPQLWLDDPGHRIIYDLKLPVRPLPLREKETDKEYLFNIKANHPQQYDYIDTLDLGYKEQVNNSLGITIQLILLASHCQVNYTNICSKMYAYIKEHLIYHQILHEHFNDNSYAMKQFMENIKQGFMIIDKGLHTIRTLALILYRTFKIINTTNLYDKQKIIIFNEGKTKPPFFLILYERDNKYIVRPCVLDLHSEYSLKRHRGSFEVVTYYSTTVPPKFQTLDIMHLEYYALMMSLVQVEHLVGRDELLVLTDNKSLYYICHAKVQQSCDRLKRWALIIFSTIEHKKIAFISSQHNLADYLSRHYQIAKPEVNNCMLPTYVKDELSKYIPEDTTFTMQQWQSWVDANPQFLGFTPKEKRNKALHDAVIKLLTYNCNTQSNNQTFDVQNHDVLISIKHEIIINKLQTARTHLRWSQNYFIKNAEAIFNPIQSLKKILTHEKIITEQQKEWGAIYENCTTSKNNLFKDEGLTYTLNAGLLYIAIKDDMPKLLLTTSLLPKFVAMSHLQSNHGGALKMQTNLINYYHPDLSKYTVRYAKVCFACTLNNPPNRGETLGKFPLDTVDPCKILNMDLMENIGLSSQHQHLLVARCPISSYVILCPMQSKTGNEFLYLFSNYIYPHFHPTSVYADNGPCFNNKDTIRALAILGTRLIYSSAFSPYSHGSAEAFVGVFKRAMKKVLVSQPNLNWTVLPPLLAHLHNTSKNAKTSFSPSEILYGTNVHLSSNNIDTVELPKLHPLIRNEKAGLEQQHKEIRDILKITRDKIVKERDERVDKANENRITRDLKVGHIVFAKDMTQVIGASRPLKSYYKNSPLVVIYVREPHLLAKRLTDNVIINRNKHHFKKYIKFDPDFKDLPIEVRKVCESDLEITQTDIENLLKVDDLSLEIFEETDDTEENEKLIKDFSNNKPPKDDINDIVDQIFTEDPMENMGPVVINTRNKLQEEIKKRVSFDPNIDSSKEDNSIDT
jgi:hypothetical protein